MFTSKLVAIIGVIMTLFGSIGTGIVIHKIDHAHYADLELSYQLATGAALKQALSRQKAEDAIVLAGAVAEAKSQQQIGAVTIETTKEIVRHVSDHSNCITLGLVRVLDAEVLSVAPGSLSLASGQSDDTCAPIKASALATSIVANYGIALQNAEQLNALEDSVRMIYKASDMQIPYGKSAGGSGDQE